MDYPPLLSPLPALTAPQRAHSKHSPSLCWHFISSLCHQPKRQTREPWDSPSLIHPAPQCHHCPDLTGRAPLTEGEGSPRKLLIFLFHWRTMLETERAPDSGSDEVVLAETSAPESSMAGFWLVLPATRSDMGLARRRSADTCPEDSLSVLPSHSRPQTNPSPTSAPRLGVTEPLFGVPLGAKGCTKVVPPHLLSFPSQHNFLLPLLRLQSPDLKLHRRDRL